MQWEGEMASEFGAKMSKAEKYSEADFAALNTAEGLHHV